MSNSKESFGSRFLYAEDLLIQGQFRSPKVTISDVHRPGTLRSGDGRVIDKWTVGFEGKEKLFVLCKTNVSILHFLTGHDAGEGWIGATVTIQARIVKAFGSDTTAIRILPPVGTTLRKTLIDRLGKKAVFQGTMPSKQQSAGEKPEGRKIAVGYIDKIKGEKEISELDAIASACEHELRSAGVSDHELKVCMGEVHAAGSARYQELSAVEASAGDQQTEQATKQPVEDDGIPF